MGNRIITSDTALRNPFVVEGYAGMEYFCDREEETATLISALENGRNVTLISPRRMGKSGLIHHAFSRIKRQNPEISTYYLDILHTNSLRQFVEALAKEILGSLDSKLEKALNKFVTVLRNFRPTIDMDPLTGLPSVSFDIHPGQEEHSLKELLGYLKASGKRCYVAIDEFQQITEYPEKGVEALLRSYIQFMSNVNFIFSGSKQHLMREMFTSASHPFYQSTQSLSLKPISEDNYYEFSSKHFQKRGYSIDKVAFKYIYDNVKGHTWYIQYWLNKIYEWTQSDISEQEVRQALQRILREEDDNLYEYFSTRTAQQQRVLTAIAKEGEVSSPQSTTFLNKYSLPPSSTVKSCIKSLLESEFLIDNRGSISVYNRFLMLWLRYR